MTVNRVKVVFLQTGTEPSYIMLYKQKINPQTEINTRRAFLDTIVFAMLFLQKNMILLYYKKQRSSSTSRIQDLYWSKSTLSQVSELLARLLPSCFALFWVFYRHRIWKVAQLCLKLAFLLYFLIEWRTMILEIVISFLSQTGTF